MTLSHEITGHTRLFGIVADPVRHVKTPQAINGRMWPQGIDGVLLPFHVAPDGLAEAMTGLRRIKNLEGFIVTVPPSPPWLRCVTKWMRTPVSLAP